MMRLIYGLFLLLISFKLMHVPTAMDASLGRLPILHDGRVKPLDTLGRQTLLQLQGRLRHPRELSPSVWLFSLLTQENSGKDDAILLVEHPQLFDSVNPIYRKQKYRVSESFLDTHMGLITPFVTSARMMEKTARTPIQTASLVLSQRHALHLSIRSQFFPFYDGSQLGLWNQMLHISQSFSSDAIEATPQFRSFLTYYNQLAQSPATYLFIFNDTWQTLPAAALDPTQSKKEVLSNYLLLSDAFQKQNPSQVHAYSKAILDAFRSFSTLDYWRIQLEFIFNAINPFIVSLFLYAIMVFMVFSARFFGLKQGPILVKDTWRLALIMHTFGLVARSLILGRPPVINLYSSAIFIAYVASIIGYMLFRYRHTLFYAGYTGILSLLSLIVAYHLSLSGDTMIVMEAVLNSNFWLATHVVAMTIGYAIILMAGFFAISYILMGTLTRFLTSDLDTRLVKLVYIFLMIALFFNFLGTVLGGIWADQSWGRFWGWDPKENGAILIVLWIAIILHMKWGRLLTSRWLMVLTVFANIVTAWSWKGTNMLGIGLHSYGFTEKTFYWLMLFFASQLAIMILGILPKKYWLSHHQNDKR